LGNFARFRSTKKSAKFSDVNTQFDGVARGPSAEPVDRAARYPGFFFADFCFKQISRKFPTIEFAGVVPQVAFIAVQAVFIVVQAVFVIVQAIFVIVQAVFINMVQTNVIVVQGERMTGEGGKW
jgi:hypothetical protein